MARKHRTKAEYRHSELFGGWFFEIYVRLSFNESAYHFQELKAKVEEALADEGVPIKTDILEDGTMMTGPVECYDTKKEAQSVYNRMADKIKAAIGDKVPN